MTGAGRAGAVADPAVETAGGALALFSQWARAVPGRTAVDHPGGRIGYGELADRATDLAGALVRAGVRRGDVVGVTMERSPLLPVTVLAVWLAGAAHVPLPASHPVARNRAVVAEAGIRTLVTDGEVDDALHAAAPGGVLACVRPEEVAAFGGAAGGTVGVEVRRSAHGGAAEAPPGPLSGDALGVLLADAPGVPAGRLPGAAADEAPGGPVGGLPSADPRSGDALAYIVYTSGSAGAPKGALIPHRAVVNLARGLQRVYGDLEGARVLQFAPFTFDVWIWELAMSLLSGGTLVVPPADVPLHGPELSGLLRERDITHLSGAASLLATLPEDEPLPVTTLTSGGEPLPEYLVRRWGTRTRLFNAYGPTEAGVCASVGRCRPGQGMPTIGHPLPGVTLHLLDERGVPVPDGERGELYIGGPGVGLGYLNRPTATRRHFLPDPFTARPGLLYRTGDLARRLPGGAYLFLGRIDGQLNVRGYRIEPGEVEIALLRHPRVTAAVVTATGGPVQVAGAADPSASVGRDGVVVPDDKDEDSKDEDDKDEGDEDGVAASVGGAHPSASDAETFVPVSGSAERLTAYLQIAPGGPLTVADLRRHLAALLPAHLVPSSFVLLDRLPLNAHGKADRAALAALADRPRDPAPGPSGDERDRAAPGPSAGDRDAPGPNGRTHEAGDVAALVGAVLGVDAAGPDDALADLGATSLDLVRLQAAIAERWGIRLAAVELFEARTVGRLVALVEHGRRERLRAERAAGNGDGDVAGHGTGEGAVAGHGACDGDGAVAGAQAGPGWRAPAERRMTGEQV
ncbi:non-ribosomal peptide synthetase [Streptomyces sp. NPDC003077]|uniref:non-ribosomal peptide synthetase n=1 Tax=Streptomyces sp. NPDC003077 TaxID=3154443 RepID=UPI0033AAB658